MKNELQNLTSNTVKQEFDEFLNVWIESKVYQPLLFSFRYNTSFVLLGKFKTIKINDDIFLKSVTLKYKRMTGLLNFGIHKIISVKREQNGTITRDALTITIRLKAYQKNSNTEEFFKLDEELLLQDNDIIFVNIIKDIANFDLENDIHWNEETLHDQIDICHSHTRP